MTLDEFIALRRDELVTFFRERFGKSWRQIVARQSNLHPRFFWRWKAAQPVVLCKRILILEKFARSIGFRAATDEKVESKLREHRTFKEAAEREVAEAQEKRNQASPATQERDRHYLDQRIAAMLSGMMVRDKPNQADGS